MKLSVISLICVAAWNMPISEARGERGEQHRRGEHRRDDERLLRRG